MKDSKEDNRMKNKRKEMMIMSIENLNIDNYCHGLVNFLKLDKGFIDVDTGIKKEVAVGFFNIEDTSEHSSKDQVVDFKRIIELDEFIIRFGKSISEEMAFKISEEIANNFNLIEKGNKNV